MLATSLEPTRPDTPQRRRGGASEDYSEIYTSVLNARGSRRSAAASAARAPLTGGLQRGTLPAN